MIDWNDAFFNKSIIDSINPETVNLINSTKNTNNIEHKIEEQEIDYIGNLDKIKQAFNTGNIGLKYKNNNSLEIIQREYDIIKLISKYALQNNKLDYSFIIPCLKYILVLSEILRIRLNQPIITL